MAENENGQEKTEAPSSKRLQDARERGDVPRSRELNTAVMLLASACGLLAVGHGMGEGLARLLSSGLRLSREQIYGSDAMAATLGHLLFQGLIVLLPLSLILFVAALMAPLLMGGFAVSAQSLVPDLQRINPSAGLKRLLGPTGLAELAKSVAKMALVTIVGWSYFHGLLPELLNIGELSVEGAIAQSFKWVARALLVTSAALILVAAIDVPFQLWLHRRKLRMTREETREEAKGSEGNPEIKGRIRRLQREMAARRMMAEVPHADVVVTNPTHFAVALKYDENKMNAPRVLAKGADLVAAQIRLVAAEHHIPLFAAPPLARALYRTTELGQEIPAGLYLAMARVLAYVYQLRLAIGAGAPTPPPPGDIEVPEEFNGDHI
ncbi:MAG: flagellar biosynthesis protein FlhB [Porticoccaceae bacterium]